jgi:RNA polymerase sigma-70 factor (ECF subfamily)
VCIGVEVLTIEDDRAHLDSDAVPAADFSDFYRREWPAIVALAYVLTGSVSTAEDLAQDVFIKVHRNWPKISTYDRPDAWARRVAINLAVSRARRWSREARGLLRLRSSTSEAAEVRPLSPESNEFWRCVRALSPRQAQIVALHYVDDRTTREIAEMLACSESTIRVHLHNAHKTLSALLGARRANEETP